MDSLSSVGALLVLLTCSSISSSSAMSKCKIYNKDWKCSNESQSLKPNDVNKDCSRDLVGTTLKLFETGSKYIKYSKDGSAVMAIGLTGTGKSTFVYFVAGDEKAMVSYSHTRGNYRIKDCNGKIVSGIASGTIYPDLVHDQVTGNSFYDNPGFQDNRSPCIEIANSYFMHNVTSSLKKVQFLVAIEHDNIVNLDRRAIADTLRSVISFVPNIEKFKTSFTLVSTKLKVAEDTDDEFVGDLVESLREVKSKLPDVGFTQDELAKANLLLDTLIARRQIVVFRVPNECGPLNEIPLMQYNKRNITATFKKAQFVACTPSDFNMTISGGAKNEIKNIANSAYPKIKNSLVSLLLNISDSWRNNVTSANDIFDRLGVANDFLITANQMLEDSQNLSRSAKTFSGYFEGIKYLLISNVPNFELQISEFYDSSKTVVDFLDYLLAADAGRTDWRAYDWNVFNRLVSAIQMEADFIRIMIHLYKGLATAEIQHDEIKRYKEWYNTNRPVSNSSENFDKFWIKFEPLISPFSKKDLQNALNLSPDGNFKTLNSLLSTTLALPSHCGTVDESGVVVYKSNYLNFKNIFSLNCAHEGLRIKTIVALALDTTFIDRDFISSNISKGAGINLVVISPRMKVENQNALVDLSGFSPKSADPIPCCGSTAGQSGASGYDGGTFYAITDNMSSSHYSLKVDCSGGDGADGQVGQQGIAGTKGGTQAIRNINNDDCAGWRGGTIQVRKYPNSCNGRNGLSDVCNAGNGKHVDVYGNLGEMGGSGGTGGDGGSGGRPGVCRVICPNCERHFNLNHKYGGNGKDGSKGRDGAHGKCGDTLVYNMYSYYHAGRVENVCWSELITTKEHKAGEPCNGTPYNQNGNALVSKKPTVSRTTSSSNSNPVNIEQYKRQFEALAQNHYNNEFIGKNLKAFVESLKRKA